jgi:hypothetical protein
MTPEEWKVRALQAAEWLLDGTHAEKLVAESWWRDELRAPKPKQLLDTPHFLPTSAGR